VEIAVPRQVHELLGALAQQPLHHVAPTHERPRKRIAGGRRPRRVTRQHLATGSAEPLPRGVRRTAPGAHEGVAEPRAALPAERGSLAMVMAARRALHDVLPCRTESGTPKTTPCAACRRS